MSSLWGGAYAVPGAPQEEVQEAMVYPPWSPAGGCGWRQGVGVTGIWGTENFRVLKASRLEPGYRASTKGPSGRARPKPWGSEQEVSILAAEK